ncbi:MAG: type III-B CRISPR module RAMP protein Cmr6 [Desulfobacterium sp.]|nr:type III-B CRISPR module RAMP protein Cmr6 [Desulfobacterium sp.]
MAYPFYVKLQNLSQNMPDGNFGLWYNKFIPISNFDDCKAADEKGNKDNAVTYYHDKYKQLSKDKVNQLLEAKHSDQANYCIVLSPIYETVIFKATLKTPLITGIGETHPHEVSMVFDHNMGTPYVPASGIKGILRFAHTIGLIPDIPPEKIETDKKTGKLFFNDEEDWTGVPQLFGTQAKRGSVFFLDAYPEKMPDLHVDIMNPHYGDYYSDDTNRIPPGDYLNPVPLKFLTVAKDTVFIFRALVDKKNPELTGMMRKAFRKALTEEGVGAKTAVGYGLFDNLKEEESESVLESIKKEKEKKVRFAEAAIAKDEAERLANMSEEDKMIEEIASLQNDPNQISLLVKRCLSENLKNFVYTELKNKLEELGQWKPDGSKQRKAKMKERNTEIESKIHFEK